MGIGHVNCGHWRKIWSSSGQYGTGNIIWVLSATSSINVWLGTLKGVILTYYWQHSTRWGWFIVEDITFILSHQPPGHCQCVVIGGCCCIGQYLGCDAVYVSTVLSHCTVVACPGDSSGRTTSGGAGESECWSRGVQFWGQLKLHGRHCNIPWEK